MNIFINILHRPIDHYGLLILFTLLSACVAQKTKPDESTPSPPVAAAPPVEKPEVRHGPDDPASRIYLGSDGKLAGRGTPDRPASEVFRMARGEHPKALSLPGLPKDKFGLIDWDAMVKQQQITPVGSLQSGTQETPLLELDVLIHTKGDFVRNVMFRHAPHVYWLDCQNCHTGIFAMGRGQNKMSMQEIVKGQWCGRCHGKVSFPLTDCNRCHSQAKK